MVDCACVVMLGEVILVSIRVQGVYCFMLSCDNVEAMLFAVASALIACSCLFEHDVCNTRWHHFLCRSLAVMCRSMSLPPCRMNKCDELRPCSV